MPEILHQIAESTTLDPQQITASTTQIHASLLSNSTCLDDSDFTRIRPNDLKLMFAEYDNTFFGGQIEETLGTIPLTFRLSKRMTSSGGMTTHFTHRQSGEQRYQISISTTILFGCFGGKDHRSISVNGIVCRDRLGALQRIMEHEMVHLIEMLVWGKSSCKRSRFGSITQRFFGHTENTHRLITPKEKARVQFGIKPGTVVRFRFDGAMHQGIVNRVTKRATVLVEDPHGERYTDGVRYIKFYIPVQFLETVE